MNAKVRAIYFKELVDTMRDRRTIFATAIIPILIYPLMTLGMAEVLQMAKAKLDSEEFPVAVLSRTEPVVKRIHEIALATPEPLKGLQSPVAEKKTKTPVNDLTKATSPIQDEDPADAPLDTFQKTKFVFKEMTLDAAHKALATGDVRAIFLVPESFETEVLSETVPNVSIEYDQAERVSLSTYSRLRSMLERYESAIVKKRFNTQQLSATMIHPFTLEAKNTAVAEKLGGSLVGGILPLIFIVMLMTGALYPAIDMTAGEKERSTLETLVGAPVWPLEIIAGKFLAVATLSLANAALNVGSFALSIALLPLPANMELQFPWSALPLTLALLIPLALFFSALLLMVSSFAANTKEAQVFCMPVFLIPTIGMAISMTPGIELQGPLLLTPIINTALLIKELFLFHATAQQFAFVFLSTCLYACGMVTLAARVFAREEVMFSAQGSLRLFLSRRFFKEMATPRPGDALLAAALMFPANFYVSLWLQKLLVHDVTKPLEWQAVAVLLIIPQYGLFLTVPLLVSRYLKTNLRTTFQWRRPSAQAVAGALMMGASSWVVVTQLVAWQSRFWPYNSMEMGVEHAFKQLAETLPGQIMLIFLIALTPAICEEHFFRGFFQQGLGHKKKWGTIVLVGAVFGFFHFPVFRMPITATLGMVLAYTAWQTRSIWPGVIMHFMHNSLSLIGPGLFHMPEDEKRLPGAPLPDVPLQLFIPAAVIFGFGLFIVSRSAPKSVAEAPPEPTFLD